MKSPLPLAKLRKKSEEYAVNRITVVNIAKGSGGVPTNFVQDCRHPHPCQMHPKKGLTGNKAVMS